MNDLVGREFDWYGIDCNGAVAIFATAGSGAVPHPVLNNIKDHDSISEQLETTNWGSELVWADLANYGLFVFDWKLNNGPYIKVSAPTNALAKELGNKILNIPHIPSLNVDFNKIEEFNV